MIVKTKAIVLRTIKFKDTGLIVKCYTEEGLKSYIIKGVLGSKKSKFKIAYFQPLNLLEIIANHNNKGTLNSIREVRLSYAYSSVSNDIVKQSLVMFLAEVLNFSLKEEESNIALFNYLNTSLQWLDLHTNNANFHLIFLLKLTQYLGFYPQKKDLNSRYFDLQEGVFKSVKTLTSIEGKEILIFKALLGTNFDDMQELKLNKKERQMGLETLIGYFELHLSGFRKLNSLPILHTVFN